MPAIERRIAALENRVMRDRKNCRIYEVVVFESLDTPEVHERKIRQIAEIEASGGDVFAITVVGANKNPTS